MTLLLLFRSLAGVGPVELLPDGAVYDAVLATALRTADAAVAERSASSLVSLRGADSGMADRVAASAMALRTAEHVG